MLLMDEAISALQRLYLRGIVVHANHLMSHLSETNGSDKANVTGTNNRDIHSLTHEDSISHTDVHCRLPGRRSQDLRGRTLQLQQRRL